jgi:hypothetical protein
MKTATRLIKFYEKHRWARKAFARNQSGKKVSPLDKSACSFCISGALTKLKISEYDYVMFLHNFLQVTGESNLLNWNDYICKSKVHLIKTLKEIQGL